MFTQPEKPYVDYPSLNTKGGETKHLLPALCWVMSLLDDGSELHRQILVALVALNKFVIIVDHTDWVPTARESDRLLRYATRFLSAYEWLSNWAEAENRMLFKIVPKFHTFHHLAIKARWLSPKLCWCFKAEDYVGKISKIAASCIFGLKATKLSIKLMDKWLLMFHFRITRPVIRDWSMKYTSI